TAPASRVSGGNPPPFGGGVHAMALVLPRQDRRGVNGKNPAATVRRPSSPSVGEFRSAAVHRRRRAVPDNARSGNRPVKFRPFPPAAAAERPTPAATANALL